MKPLLNTFKQILYNKMDRVTYPAYCTFHVTWRCNLNCVMCNQDETREIEKKEEMNLDEIQRAFTEMGKLDVIKLTGGEPFLRNDLKEMVKFFKKVNRPHTIYITTNGMFTERVVDLVEKIGGESLLIAFSIDGSAEIHDNIRGYNGSYKKIMETIGELERLKDMALNIQINQTIMTDNINEIGKLEKISQNGRNYPVHYMIAEASFVVEGQGIETPMDKESYYYQLPKERLEEVLSKISQGRQAGFLQTMLDQYYYKGLKNRLLHRTERPRIRCTAMHSNFRIFPNGDILACGRDNRPVGNLRKQSFREIWFGEEAGKKREIVRRCEGCWSRCEVIPSAIYSGEFWKGVL